MSTVARKKPYKKIAMALSLCAIILWAVLGAGASMAWFADVSPENRNIFHFGDFDLVVSHRLDDGSYEPIDAETRVFDDAALYEPGYTQVVYLKIENRGDIAFDFKTAVNVTDYTIATNYYGRHFNLQDYLQFGLVTASTEAALQSKVADRAMAADIATMRLNNYSTDEAALGGGETVYMALIVRMPEEVGNDANYRGTSVPTVELGLIVNASQQK